HIREILGAELAGKLQMSEFGADGEASHFAVNFGVPANLRHEVGSAEVRDGDSSPPWWCARKPSRGIRAADPYSRPGDFAGRSSPRGFAAGLSLLVAGRR